MISGLPRPATTGSASRAPASASLRISGSGLISLFIGMKPDTMAPGAIGDREGARRDRLGGGGALGRGSASRRASASRRSAALARPSGSRMTLVTDRASGEAVERRRPA